MENKLLEAKKMIETKKVSNGNSDPEEQPVKTGKERRELRRSERRARKAKREYNKQTSTTPWGLYGAIVDEKGKTIKNPTLKDQNRVMMQYLKNNNPEDSNVYRQQFIHSAKNYNPKMYDYFKGGA